ncbi:FGGY family carbohydrate kinase [Patulibacter sp. SYSU D01012]|uniref:FGGY family carbohydrate kinase n=1 Tax=Patulibacter sp. SYSU D01012 TaxID=2817381 RepID=UPI001B315007|nr:FGGY family carbohydrate kinase [Patulibacter sp. SYSU D01012]
MTAVLIGLDVGTTSAKAVALDETGEVLGEGRRPTPWRTVPTGAELDALALLDAARAALADAAAAAGGRPVAAVGVASMGESGVLLDGRGTPVAPVIAWHDRRDEAEVARLGADLGADALAVRTGLPLRAQWSLTKHRWLLDHHEGARSAVRRLGVAEWIVRGLGGEESSEASLASRTGWLELTGRAWWAEALEWSGATAGLLPPLAGAGTPLGVVTASGLPDALAGAVLAVAGHDHQAAAVGLDAAGPGDLLDSCGTAEALIRTVAPDLRADAIRRLVAAGTTVGWHAAAGCWCVLGGTEGGLLLGRVLERLGVGSQGLAALDAEAGAAADVAVRVVRGVDGDVRIEPPDAPAGAVWRAAVAAAGEDARGLHAAIADVVGPAERVVVTGGWARSATVRAAKRATLGPFERRTDGEPGARGAALLAGLAAGVYADRREFPEPPR